MIKQMSELSILLNNLHSIRNMAQMFNNENKVIKLKS